ncbi:MAG: AraC family transcriptional regulator [Gammaproteobacteria bacterium]|nr:AraC family transcriptional regulator [Gammaproteobacteria bacterium]
MTEATTIVTWAIAIRGALEAQNLLSESLFAEAGLDISWLKDPNARYPVDNMSRLWELATEASGNYCFPLTVPQYVQPGTLHGLGPALLASDTMADALQRLVRFSHIVSTAAHIIAHQHDDELVVEFVPTIAVVRHGMEAFIATTVQIARMMLQDYSGTATRIELRSPTPENRDDYESFFECPVSFEQDRWALVVNSDLTNRPLPLANAAIAAANDSVITAYLAELTDNIVDKTRQAILDALASGLPSIELIASKLHLSARSLQRQLSDAGESFTQLREKVQQEMAQNWLRNSNRSLVEITFRLGFSDQSNFSRAFKRWTGLTPSQYREQENA